MSSEQRKFPKVLFSQIHPYQTRINSFEDVNELDADKLVAEYKLVRVGKLDRSTKIDWQEEQTSLLPSDKVVAYEGFKRSS